jgi:hypothetical protein
MAEHKVQGGTMLLFIDPNGGTDYDVVVCLTSVAKSDSVTVVDASSACGPDKSPGTLEISYSFEGQHLQDPDTGKISGTDLRSLLRSETTIGWKIAPEVPVAGDEIETGTGYLSELSSTYAFDSVGTFTGTLQPFGTPTLSIEGGGGGFTIGQPYLGGIIAWLDVGGTTGIIVQENIFGGKLLARYSDVWSTPDNNDTGATSTGWGFGTFNTNDIIANTTTSIAEIIFNDTYGGFSDWVMPSLDDMANILSNGTILNIGAGSYFTSTQNDNTSVKSFDWDETTATQLNLGKNLTLEAFGVKYF